MEIEKMYIDDTGQGFWAKDGNTFEESVPGIIVTNKRATVLYPWHRIHAVHYVAPQPEKPEQFQDEIPPVRDFLRRYKEEGN